MPSHSRLLALLLLGLAAGLSAQAQPAYSCDAQACSLPDCHCASTQPPDGLQPSDTPQFVLVTFDDCVRPDTEALIRPVLEGVRNPNGEPLSVTYFLSLVNCPGGGSTEPATVFARHALGDEIAVHTVTHNTSEQTEFFTWREEIVGVLSYLRTIGLPSERRGFRAPYVSTNAALYDAMETLGLLYDASIHESPFFSPVSNGPSQMLWPYTLDYGPAQNCAFWDSSNQCTDDPKRGLWSIPLYYHVDVSSTGERTEHYYGSFDVGNPFYSYGPALSGEPLYRVLTDNYTARHRGNRAPHGVFLHAPTFADPGFQQTYNRALRYMATQPDTWFVTMSTLIRWMQDPVPASQMADWIAGRPTTEVAAQAPEAVRLFPTLTRGTVRVQGGQLSDEPLAVYDLLGRRVLATRISSGEQIDLEALPSGRYFIRLAGTTHAVTLQR
jgi:hypothetical protein